MANLVDHYLLQLRSLLPAKLRDDVAAELGESIHAAIAERELGLGHALGDEEIATVLKTYGHPLIVAGRYLPVQELISPRVFPLYWYALQAVVIVIAVITGILGGIALLTLGRSGLMQILADGLWFALCAAALVTIVFAILDHYGAGMKTLENFDPRKLELGIFGVRAAPLSPIPRADTVFEIAMLGIFVAWWIGLIEFTPVLGSGVAIGFTGKIEPFFWPVLALSVIDLARLGLDFAYPYRTWPRVLARLIINVAWLTALALVFRMDGLLAATAASDGATASSALVLAQMVFQITVGMLAVVTGALIATDVVRLIRR